MVLPICQNNPVGQGFSPKSFIHLQFDLGNCYRLEKLLFHFNFNRNFRRRKLAKCQITYSAYLWVTQGALRCIGQSVRRRACQEHQHQASVDEAAEKRFTKTTTRTRTDIALTNSVSYFRQLNEIHLILNMLIFTKQKRNKCESLGELQMLWEHEPTSESFHGFYGFSQTLTSDSFAR